MKQHVRFLMTMAAFGAFAGSTAHAQDSTAAGILARHAKAIGGREAFARHVSLHREGKIQIDAFGITGTVVIDREKSGGYLVVRELPGLGRSEQGFVDGAGWDVAPGQSAPKLLVGAQLKERRRAARFDADLRDERALAVIGAPRRAVWQGRPAWQMEVLLADSSRATDYYDLESGRWSGTVDEVASAAGVLRRETVVLEYGDFGGVYLPVTIKQVLPQYTSVTTYTSTVWDAAAVAPIPRPVP